MTKENLAKALAEIERLKEENMEMEHILELQRRRTREATSLWREVHPGNDNVFPDLGVLLEWLLQERGRLMKLSPGALTETV